MRFLGFGNCYSPIFYNMRLIQVKIVSSLLLAPGHQQHTIPSWVASLWWIIRVRHLCCHWPYDETVVTVTVTVLSTHRVSAFTFEDADILIPSVYSGHFESHGNADILETIWGRGHIFTAVWARTLLYGKTLTAGLGGCLPNVGHIFFFHHHPCYSLWAFETKEWPRWPAWRLRMPGPSVFWGGR